MGEVADFPVAGSGPKSPRRVALMVPRHRPRSAVPKLSSMVKRTSGIAWKIAEKKALISWRPRAVGVPEHVIAVRDLVDRKVTLEHAARSPEGRDLAVHVWAESRGHLFRRRRFGVPIKAQGGVALTQAAELDEYVGPGSESLDGQ